MNPKKVLKMEVKRITNIMLFLSCLVSGFSATAQTYHPDDKEGLRIFLRQASAEDGKINAEQLGLQISDTANWQTDETWVTMIEGLTWNTETPKRLTAIDWQVKKLAGTIDLSNITEITVLSCRSNKITNIDVSNNTALTSLDCYNNLLTNLDVNNNMTLTDLWCDYNQITNIDVSNNTALTHLQCRSNQLTNLNVSNTALTSLFCDDNHLSLSDLFIASEILESNNAYITNRYLGSQALPVQTATVGVTIDFPVSQNVFNGIFTEFAVTKNGIPAPTSDYVVIDGKITFYTPDIYIITMTNSAIISWSQYPAQVTFGVMVTEEGGTSQPFFNSDDKEGLRAFLRQPSAEAGKINAEQLGLQINDTLNWQNDELWVIKVVDKWNEENPKRLTELSSYWGHWANKNLAGSLIANKWTKLQGLGCPYNQLTRLDVSNNMYLMALACSGNSLPLSDLFAASEILENNGANIRYLGSQTLPKQEAIIGASLSYTVSQNIFNGIYTEYCVTQNGDTASASDYFVTDGNITFNTPGNYTVTMTNQAIISAATFPARVTFDVTVGTSGIVDGVLPDINVYPNPTDDKFIVDIKNFSTIKLYDMIGKEVLSKYANGKTEIDISHLPSGIYSVRVISKEGVIRNGKVVKQ